MSTLTLSPVSVGVYTALNVSGLTSLCSGPFDTEVPQVTSFPMCWFVLTEENARGMGTGGLRKLFLRVHAAAKGSTTLGVAKQLQGILAQAVTLLEDASLTVSGYRTAGQVFYDSTTEPFPSEIGGVQCWEAAALFYLWVEP